MFDSQHTEHARRDIRFQGTKWWHLILLIRDAGTPRVTSLAVRRDLCGPN
jgi:hypothetical protein